MAVKIRLKRLGKVKVPQYRIVVVDSRKKRDGRVIEEIGKYHPKEDPSYIDVVSDRAQYWLGVGAQPSDAVAVILKITGDWQKFRGEPGAEGTLKVAEPKRDKLDAFNEALKDAAKEPKGAAVTKKTAKKADKDEAAAADEPKAEAPKVEEPKTEEPKTEDAPTEEGQTTVAVPVSSGSGSTPSSDEDELETDGDATILVAPSDLPAGTAHLPVSKGQAKSG